MLQRILSSAAFLLAIPRLLFGQSAPPIDRTDRVVIYSPHFDVPPAPWAGFSCPRQPLRLFGFESGRGADSIAHLAVRVYSHRTADGDPTLQPLAGAMVQLLARRTDARFVDLPRTAEWMVRADSEGAARLVAPVGVYMLTVKSIGYATGEAVVQFRGGEADSLHIHAHPTRIC